MTSEEIIVTVTFRQGSAHVTVLKAGNISAFDVNTPESGLVLLINPAVPGYRPATQFDLENRWNPLYEESTSSKPEQGTLPEYRRLRRANGAAMVSTLVNFSSVRTGGTPLRVDVRHEGEDLHLAFTLPATDTQPERVVPIQMKRDDFLDAVRKSKWASFTSAAWSVAHKN